MCCLHINIPEGIQGLSRATFLLTDRHDEYNCEIGGRREQHVKEPNYSMPYMYANICLCFHYQVVPTNCAREYTYIDQNHELSPGNKLAIQWKEIHDRYEEIND